MITTSATALRMARVARGTRLADAAQLVGLQESRLSHVETRNVRIRAADLEALAAVYDVPLGVLRGEEPMILRARAPLVHE